MTSYRCLPVATSATAGSTAAGLIPYDVPDADDFVLSMGSEGPARHMEAVVYQIFPDRFATSGRNGSRPEWAVPRAWDELPTGRGPATPRELFGGDLAGVEEHRDHVERLGADVIYLTPIFPATSTHRYDSTSLDRVDLLLGGDDALASLTAAAHGRGIRVIGDLTLNHVGVGHDWFVAAHDDPTARPSGASTSTAAAARVRGVAWRVRTLPKVNWSSPGAPAPHGRSRALLAGDAVRAGRLAHRRGEHGGPLRRARADRRRGARDAERRGGRRDALDRGARLRLPGGPPRDGWNGR